jgi:hypothetical protein
MMLHCDYCGCLYHEIFMMPTTGFYVEQQNVITTKSYINLCKPCLVQKEIATNEN